MRIVAAAIVAGSLVLAIVAATVALAQSTSAPAPTGSTAATPPAAAAGPATAAAPAPGGKKLACQTASEAMKGQARKDQMQLCMMQARLDCLKQAIDQNIVGPQRKDFVKSCVG
jgi:3-oxoacyl-ACP reductase-like protein